MRLHWDFLWRSIDESLYVREPRALQYCTWRLGVDCSLSYDFVSKHVSQFSSDEFEEDECRFSFLFPRML